MCADIATNTRAIPSAHKPTNYTADHPALNAANTTAYRQTIQATKLSAL